MRAACALAVLVALWTGWIPCQAQVTIENTAAVVDEVSFLAALRNPEVACILLLNSLKLSAKLWPPRAVAIARTLLITIQYPGVVVFTIDASEAARGAVSLFPGADVKLEGPGLTVLNAQFGGPSAFDFSTALPSFMSVSNSTLELHYVDVISATPTGLWSGANAVYAAENAWWAGNMSVWCQSSTAIVIDLWQSFNKARATYIKLENADSFSGWIKLTKTRMLLDQKYACSQFNTSTCTGVLQVCNSTKSTTPLPASYCAPEGIIAACRPPLPFSSYVNSDISTSDPVHETSTASDSNSRPSLWWVGLVVGLVGGVALLAGVAALFWCAVRRRRNATSSSSAKRTAEANMSMLAGGPSNTAVCLDLGTEQDACKCSLGSTESSESPGVNLEEQARRDLKPWTVSTSASTLAPAAAGLRAAADPQNSTLLDASGFSYHQLSDWSSDRQQSLQPAHPRCTVIQMATTPPGGVLQLTSNPLGVTLHAVLGSGAFGTVYSGLWNGQDVAVKVMVQKVDDVDDLAAILQFREANLGAELQHPRIVRTLAHALVVPEGLVNDDGRLVRTGVVEAHIVSALCDRGTLRAWLQATRNAPMPVGPLSSRASDVCKASDLPARPIVASMSEVSQTITANLAAPTSPPTQPTQWVVRASGRSGAAASEISPQVLAPSHDADQPPADGVQEPCTDADCNNVPVKGEAPVSYSSTESAVVLTGVYPPLACMLGQADSGTGLHGDFTCHMLAVVDILLEIADGLSYLLSKGVVHGDLKPQNCLCCSDSNTLRGFTIRICDFGISRMLHGSKSHTTACHPQGTLAYFAPELLSTCRLSPSCDLYSFGIIMYELVACKQAFPNLTMAQVLYKKVTGQVDEHLVFPPETPAAYVQLARSCYSLEAASRPSLRQVFSCLLEIRQQLLTDWHLPIAPPPAPSIPADESWTWTVTQPMPTLPEEGQ